MLIVGKQLVKSYEPVWNKASVLSLAPKLATLPALMSNPEIALFTEKHQPNWYPDSIQQARAYTVKPFLKNMLKYSNSTKHYFDNFDATQHLWVEPSFGNLNSTQHFFHHDAIEWGFNFNEPQITKGLTHFFNQSTLACWHFMLALTNQKNAEKIEFPTDDDDEQCFLKTVMARAEVQTDNKKRIDITIEWLSSTKERCLAAIECKFGHHITHGQLPSYKQYARKQPVDNYWLFLITQKIDKKNHRFMQHHHNKEWHQVRWDRLLMRWERSLTQDHSTDVQDFARFRRTLWNKISN